MVPRKTLRAESDRRIWSRVEARTELPLRGLPVPGALEAVSVDVHQTRRGWPPLFLEKL